MRAYIVDVSLPDGGHLLKDIPRPSPSMGEALVRITRIGICKTDLELLKGYKGGFTGILGHEFLGTIEQLTTEQDRLKEGQRVVGEINCRPLQGCTCRSCGEGGAVKRNHCLNRTVLGIIKKDGTFADYMTIPQENLIPVPDSVSDENATFCEPLAASLRILEQGAVTKDDDVAIIGDGKLGLIIALTIHDKCRHLTVFGHHKEKLDILKKVGITVIIEDGDIANKYESAFSAVIEATGSSSGLSVAGQLTRPLGRLVLKTTCVTGHEFNATPFVVKELRIIGSRCGDMRAAMDTLTRLDLTSLISHTYDFDDIQEAISHASKRGVLKVQVKMIAD